MKIRLLRADQAVVVERGDESRAAPRLERKEGIQHPAVRVDDVRTVGGDETRERDHRAGVGERGMKPPLRLVERRERPAPSPDAVDADTIVDLEARRVRMRRGSNGHPMSPPDELSRELSDVVLQTADDGRVRVGDHQDTQPRESWYGVVTHMTTLGLSRTDHPRGGDLVRPIGALTRELGDRLVRLEFARSASAAAQSRRSRSTRSVMGSPLGGDEIEPARRRFDCIALSVETSGLAQGV